MLMKIAADVNTTLILWPLRASAVLCLLQFHLQVSPKLLVVETV